LARAATSGIPPVDPSTFNVVCADTAVAVIMSVVRTIEICVPRFDIANLP